jgi:hypothetical protein
MVRRGKTIQPTPPPQSGGYGEGLRPAGLMLRDVMLKMEKAFKKYL